VKLVVKQEDPEETIVEGGEDEVNLDPWAEFEEGCPAFDEPMATVQLGSCPHPNTRLGSSTY